MGAADVYPLVLVLSLSARRFCHGYLDFYFGAHCFDQHRYLSIYQTPWNLFIFISCLVLFLSLKRILTTMCICFVILIGHQSFIAAYFNDSTVRLSL